MSRLKDRFVARSYFVTTVPERIRINQLAEGNIVSIRIGDILYYNAGCSTIILQLISGETQVGLTKYREIPSTFGLRSAWNGTPPPDLLRCEGNINLSLLGVPVKIDNEDTFLPLVFEERLLK